MMKLFFSFLFIFCCLPNAVADDLPELGDSSATVLSPLQEQAIANQIMRDVMSSNEVIRDAEINDYVQNLGYRLGANGPDKRQQFNFFVVQDNTINAFAMYGGVIGVHTGLILAAENESELASVLGHEIGHVVQHHLARAQFKQSRDSILNIATFALAILAARSNSNLGGGALTASSALGVQKQLDYTREHEREADRVGLQILNDAGFDPRAMPEFFTILLKSSRFVDGAAPSFLRTHPLTTERISDVKNRVENMPYKQVVDSPEFLYIRAKLRANVGTAEQEISYFEDNIQQQKYTSAAAEHYGLAIALMRRNSLTQASQQIDWLHQNAPKHPYIETLAAKIEVLKNKPESASKVYSEALQDFPEHRALIYGYAEHLINQQQTEKALKLLEEKQALFPDDAYLYELKSNAYTLMGKDLLRHQAQGEAYARNYNLEKAIEQMELALKAGDGDFYQQSIVEARLKALKLQLIEPEKRGWFD